MSRRQRAQAAYAYARGDALTPYQRLILSGLGADAARWLTPWARSAPITVAPPREPTRPPLLPAIASEVLVRLREPRRWRLALSSDHWLWRP